VNPDPQAIFLAWQDPASRAWFPIGKLTCESGKVYRFVYTQGFEDAQRQAGLTPLIGFAEVHQVYESTDLFPLFANRIMSRSREDYQSYLERFALPEEGASTLALLARSQGRRSTDSFEIFAHPLAHGPGGEPRYEVDCLVHGIRHMPAAAAARAEALVPGERLLLMPDPHNPEDPRAVALRTEDKVLLGYVPRYYCADLAALFAAGVRAEVRVLRTNPAPTPIQQRVLVHLEAPWPLERAPFCQPEYQQIGQRAA